MTHGPHSGQAAPVATDYGPGGAPKQGAPADVNGDQSAPTSSTPWTTSAGPRADNGSGYGSYDRGAWGSGNPAYADAPTASVPLVQGTAAPGVGERQSAPALPPPPPTSSRTSGRGGRVRGPRRARLQLRHINPWTVLKFSCVLSIALFFVWLIVVGVLYGVLDGAGIIHKINDTYTTIQGSDSKPPVTAGVVFGGAAIVGVVNIVLFVALSTVGSVVYNLCADLVGGIEITLSER